jgi:hypothetical protein
MADDRDFDARLLELVHRVDRLEAESIRACQRVERIAEQMVRSFERIEMALRATGRAPPADAPPRMN